MSSKSGWQDKPYLSGLLFFVGLAWTVGAHALLIHRQIASVAGALSVHQDGGPESLSLIIGCLLLTLGAVGLLSWLRDGTG